MIHFRQAQTAARETLIARIGEGNPIGRAVIIDDIFGKVRVLIWLTESAPQDFANQFAVLMKETIADYWSGLWVANGASEADSKLYDELWQESSEIGPSLRLSERVRSRGFWMKSPDAPAWTVDEEHPPVIAFYSFKGGVGRTTALASFAIQRARMGETVVVIDLDLDAPGVGTLLDSGSPVTEEQFGIGSPDTEVQFGIVDYLIESPLHPQTILSDYYHLCRSAGDRGQIYVFPAGRMDTDYLAMLARLDLEPASDSANHPLLNLLNHARKELNPNWILLDCRAGISEASGFALSGLANLTVLFGTTSTQSWHGLRLVIERLGAQRVKRGLPQAECLVVQAMTPENQETAKSAQSTFLAEAENTFQEAYYAAEPSDEDWDIRDMESEDAPHQPSVLYYSQRLAFIRSIADVADTLAEDAEYSKLASRIASRFTKEPE
jgi:MinD-like ATPase involved in chromosome partitioning or flagellar assembly